MRVTASPGFLSTRGVVFLITAFLLVCSASVIKAEEDEYDVVSNVGINPVLRSGPDIDITMVSKLAPGFNFTGYDLLIVEKPLIKNINEVSRIRSQQAGKRLSKGFVNELGKVGIFKKVVNSETGSQSQTDSGTALVLSSTFVRYHPGNRGLRAGVGFGAGEAILEIETEIKDLKGQLLFKGTSKEVLYEGGIYGGSLDFFYKHINSIPKKYASFMKRIATGVGVIEPEDEYE